MNSLLLTSSRLELVAGDGPLEDGVQTVRYELTRERFQQSRLQTK
jgi:hypothetical protein